MRERNEVRFFLNGKPITIVSRPDMLLIDYLRCPSEGLTGAKKACGEGGCGSCTVILSRWKQEDDRIEHRAINACLTPLYSISDSAITTIEGISGTLRCACPAGLLNTTNAKSGNDAASPALAAEDVSSRESSVQSSESLQMANRCNVGPYPLRSYSSLNPVALRLALNNGSQCGYCSPGFVMNMSEYLLNHPAATKREIEQIFDGNLCRCTGYRSILTAMKTFASDWNAFDEQNRMDCVSLAAQKPAESNIVIPFPDEAKRPAPARILREGEKTFYRPVKMDALLRVLHDNRDTQVRLVHGHTSYGLYKHEYDQARIFIDISQVPELTCIHQHEAIGLRVSAGTTYTDLIGLLASQANGDPELTSNFGAIHYMAQRTGGRMVRNMASIGGNTMLVLKHIHTREPFVSDILSVLLAVEARIQFTELCANGQVCYRESTLETLVEGVRQDASLADRILLLNYLLPYGTPSHIVTSQKIATRAVNSQSILNSAIAFHLTADLIVDNIALVFGGIAPLPWRAKNTEALILGRKLTLADFPLLATALAKEIDAETDHWSKEISWGSTCGVPVKTKIQMAIGFLYKTLITTMKKLDQAVPDEVRSAEVRAWHTREVSVGKQSYPSAGMCKPLGEPVIKTRAIDQALGRIHYTHEIKTPHRTAHAAFVQSRRALAAFQFVLPGEELERQRWPHDQNERLNCHLARLFPSFIALVTKENIPLGGENYQGLGNDQPVFADVNVYYVGQAVGLVLALSDDDAQRIAAYVDNNCVAYGPAFRPEGWIDPIIGIDSAILKNSIFPDSPAASPRYSHIWQIVRPGTELDWITHKKNPLDKRIDTHIRTVDGVSCIVVEATQAAGGQIHFYMEPQACVVEPTDDGRMVVNSSTQSPMKVHRTVAKLLGCSENEIEVRVPPVGGSYGGKTEPSCFVAAAAALAAHVCNLPVRLAMPREQDSSMIGKRHAYYGQYQIAVDRGMADSKHRGLIRGLYVKMWGDGGAFYDCSFLVADAIQLRADNAYHIQHFHTEVDVCRTNTAPSTAFRSFGDVQAKVIIENAIEDAAFVLQMRGEDLRELNLYERGDVTPFGQALSYCYMRDVWNYLKYMCNYQAKLESVEEFNHANRWHKRGISMMPLKYGSGYNLRSVEQAAAVITVNKNDGSVVVQQGGVEIGQGLFTQVQQIAAQSLNLPMGLIHVSNLGTSVISNPTPTAASSGTALNGAAVRKACEVLRTRLMEFGYAMRTENGPEWCSDKGIDFWNNPHGWAATVALSKGKTGASGRTIWQELISLAYDHRISLISSASESAPGGSVPVPNIRYKDQADQVDIPDIERCGSRTAGIADTHLFRSFTYSAACSVVEVDILTGEITCLSTDIVYDKGRSLNPAIDIGQIEGAFVQGIGYVMCEKMVFEREGSQKGRLATLNSSGYKIPMARTIPMEFNVHMFPHHVTGIPIDENDFLGSKDVAEAPLVLATSIFVAAKIAIRASRVERGLSGLFDLDVPATVDEVCRACELRVEDYHSAPIAAVTS